MRCQVLVSCVVVLALAGCDAAENKAIAEAERVLREETVDPAAAQFRNMVVIGEHVCGEMNSPNSYGGFVGYRRFIHTKGRDSAFFDPGADNPELAKVFAYLWRTSCTTEAPPPAPKAS